MVCNIPFIINESYFFLSGYKIIQTKEEINNDQQQLFVIDYNAKDFGQELQGQNYDIVYDCVGGQEQWKSAQQIL